MLSINGLNQFYYLRDFHDMPCKYERVLSIIHQQLNREPSDGDVFIVMSRLIRLFSYDKRSYSLYEKRFSHSYKFMHVELENCKTVHKSELLCELIPLHLRDEKYNEELMAKIGELLER